MKKVFTSIFLLILLAFVSLTLVACNSKKNVPYIGENGNWWVGDEDLGVPARGDKGDKGDKGEDGKNGSNGSDISVVSVEKTDTKGLVDTYTISFSDGNKSTFTVTNGAAGESTYIDNIALTSSFGETDTYTITFSNGATKTFTVTNGRDLSVLSIELKDSVGLINTYDINYSDGSVFEFAISNGENGLTPYIGDNGNWWIGEEDTGVLVDFEKANNVPLTVLSSGLQYKTMTIDGKSGFVVTGWDASEFDDDYSYAKYGEDFDNYIDELELEGVPLVIPNYIGTVPVIGVAKNASLNTKKIVLSSNTIYLGENAFYNCKNLEEIDFNGAPLICIPQRCFAGTSLKTIDLPSTVTHIYDYAFDGVGLRCVNLSNLKYIGIHAFDDVFIDFVYLPKTVEYIGNDAFEGTFVYLETEEIPSTWGNICDDFAILTNVKNNGDYLYSVKDDEVTLYQYLGNEEKLEIPATIDDIPVTTIGAGFNSVVFDDDFNGMSDKAIYDSVKSITGYIKELIIGNNVKKIDKYALLNGNMFIFISKCVEEVYMNDDYYNKLGCFAGHYYDDRLPSPLIIIEDSSKTKFNYGGVIKTYEELTNIENDIFDFFIKTDVAYNDIYYDASNEMYYAKSASSYEVLACRRNYVEEVIVLDAINDLPVKTIGRYVFGDISIGNIVIGSNVQKIKSCAFWVTYASIYIPKSVEIINANGFYNCYSAKVYVEASSKPDDWDSNWNGGLLTITWGYKN